MIFTAPMPFQEALDAAEVKSLLPTTGRTVDLQQLSQAIKLRALWSATVTSGELLQKISDAVNGALTGQADQATLRLGIKQLLDQMGYQPEADQAGGLQDLSSDPRINLQIETNVDTARGYGWDRQGQQPDVLDEWPAQELFRAFGPKDPRHQRDWASRWAGVGGVFYGGRMIALKTDPIWNALGDPAVFPDGLGNPWPPYAFHSGMDVRDVSRDDAVQLGLIDPDTQLFPRQIDLNAQLQASPNVRDETLRALLNASGVGQFSGDVFQFTGGPST